MHHPMNRLSSQGGICMCFLLIELRSVVFYIDISLINSNLLIPVLSVCMHTNTIPTYTYKHTYTYIHTNTYTHLHISTHANTHTHTHIYILQPGWCDHRGLYMHQAELLGLHSVALCQGGEMHHDHVHPQSHVCVHGASRRMYQWSRRFWLQGPRL